MANEIRVGFFTRMDTLGPEWVPLGKFNEGRPGKGQRSDEYRALERAIHAKPPLISAMKRVDGIHIYPGNRGRIWVKESEALAYLAKLRESSGQSRPEKSRPAVVKAEPQRDLFECRADVDRLERIERSIANLSRSFAEISESIRSFMDVSESPDPVRDGWIGSDGRA